MVINKVTKGAFYWLRTPKSSGDVRTDEWILAIIRLLLSMCCLAAIFRAHSVYDIKAYAILSTAYIGYAVLIIAALYFRGGMHPLSHVAIHLFDIILASQLICLVHWPVLGSALLFFVMISTAFRWGFWEAALTFTIFYSLILAGCYFYFPIFLPSLRSVSRTEFSSEIVIYLAIVCMIGVLAEAKASRSENLAAARAVAKVRLKAGLEQALHAITMEGIRLFGANQFQVVLHEPGKNKSLLFRAVRPQTVLPACELEASEYAKYLFPEPGTSVRLAVAHSFHRKKFLCRTLDAGKSRKREVACGLPEAFLQAHPARLLLATAVTLEGGWTARVYVVDPMWFFGGMAGLRFLEQCTREIAPVMHDMLAVDRVAIKARAAASGEVARELHDGIIQSLSAINMQVENLKGKSGLLPQSARAELEQIQQTLLGGITALRDFTQQLRSLELDSQNLLSFLAGMAVKFQMEHGIATRFISELKEVQLAPQTCVQVARIVQEALANVRKHSVAGEALVMLNQQDGNYVLNIIDNGRGFRFSGRRSHEELQASGEGPIILMDRAKSIGAKVSIESFEDHGTRVEVVLPRG